jgi:surface antigen
MKKSFVSILAIVAIISLNACTHVVRAYRGELGQVGGVGGAAAGAIIGQAIGHNTEATLIGAAVGGLLGYIVGNEMDKYDREQLNYAYEHGVSGQTSVWTNPDTGDQYAVTPTRAYSRPGSSQPCRKAEIKALIGGRMEKAYATACRDAYGHWQLQK